MTVMHEFSQIGLQPNLTRCFIPLPEVIGPTDALSPKSLYEAFYNVFRCKEAKTIRDIVFVWTVDRPYIHDQCERLPSQFIYIEKTKGTMSGRWSNENLRSVTTDFSGESTGDTPSVLRGFADANLNLTFYSRLILDHGPLSIWWSSSAMLNEVAGTSTHNAEAWEGHLLALYVAKHGCRPIKNRKGGRLLQDVLANK